MWALVALACGGGPAQSVPVPATMVLGSAAETVVWSDLDGLFASGPVAAPVPLAGLKLGAPATEALAILEGARDARVRTDEEWIAGRRTFDAVLRDWPEVGVSLDLGERGDILAAYTLTVPRDQAQLALTHAWGPPDRATLAQEGLPVATWIRPDVTVEVRHAMPGRSSVHIRRSSE